MYFCWNNDFYNGGDKMKILICVENLRMDGVKRVATTIGNKLNNSFDVCYYTMSQESSFFELAAPLISSNYPVINSGSFRGDKPLVRFQKQIQDLINILQSKKFDVVILTAGLLTSFIPQTKKQIPTIKAIAWMHNNYETYLNNYYRLMQQEFISGLESADRVVVLTNHDLKKFSFHQSKTVKLYNPVTIQTDTISGLTSPVISTVSRIDIDQKGLDLLLKVAQYLPHEWKIKLAGNGPDFKILQDSIGKLRLDSKLELLGSLTDQGLRKLYQESSIFLMTSRWEGMPLVIGEAMSFGLPIISMENTGAYEYLLNNEFGIMTNDHKLESLMKQLNILMESREARTYWSTRSLVRIGDFSLSNIINQWKALLS